MILDGLDGARLFGVNNNGFLKLKNVILEDGYGSGADGAAIHSVGRLDLDHVTIRSSYTSANGGAIYATGRLDVAFSKFEDNIGGNGGAIFASGQNAELNISGSDFVNNHADTDKAGGAIYASHTLNVLTPSSRSIRRAGVGQFTRAAPLRSVPL